MASSTSSTLKLVIEKGPREGETLEFNSRSTVRIGRVVKGNNLPIKDFGISSKHLIIEFSSDSGKWEIRDLDSSNGTILNSSQLKPLSPSEICNGDQIKIGELTSIRVEIVQIDEETNNNRRITRRQAANDLRDHVQIRDQTDNYRRITRRQAASDLGDHVQIREQTDNNRRITRRQAASDLGDETSNRRYPRRRPASNSRVRDLKEDNLVKGVEENPRGRGRGRPKKVGNLEDGHSENLDVGENVEDDKLQPELLVSKRNTRRSNRGEIEFVGVVEVIQPRRIRSAKNVEGAMDMDNCKQVAENNKTRGGRGRKNKCLDDVFLEEKNYEVLETDFAQQVVDSRQKPREKLMLDNAAEQIVLNDEIDAQLLEGLVLEQEGGAGAQFVREQHCAEPMEEAAQPDGGLVGVSHVEVEVCDGVQSDAVLDGGRMVESDIEEIVNESEVKCCERSKDPGATSLRDLEKMTLGEWFEHLEVYLPKQIYAATDEIIEDMQTRAKQFDEFMLHQQKEKKNLPLAL